MYPVQSISDRLKAVSVQSGISRLSPPRYSPDPLKKSEVFLASKFFEVHTTSESYQLQERLGECGYSLYGRGYPGHRNETRVPLIVERENPKTVIVQDKREWDRDSDICWNKALHFERSECLAEHDDIFKVTILKDAHQNPEYHRRAAEEIGCHAWICYYHPRLVHAFAPYVRMGHLIRTYHSVNPAEVPEFTDSGRADRAILSGAISKEAYPLRHRLRGLCHELPMMSVLHHPGYHPKGHKTPDYLKELSKYKVSICTASVYGYALRKIIESVACGCVVVTDLPVDEVLPGIDEALIRVHPDISAASMNELLAKLIREYNPWRQAEFASRACRIYNYVNLYRKLACDIESMRNTYHFSCEVSLQSVPANRDAVIT